MSRNELQGFVQICISECICCNVMSIYCVCDRSSHQMKEVGLDLSVTAVQ
jgi:hypothetical protein